MERRTTICLAVCLALVAGCSTQSPLESSDELVVVQAYLFAGEPVDDVRLTATLPLTTDSTTPPPISDAQVALLRGGQRYDLVASAGGNGYYHYAGDDLAVQAGDRFALEIRHGDQTITGETTVPAPPVGVTISKDRVEVPIFSFGLGSMPDRESMTVTVRWRNEAGDLHFLAVDNVEVDPEAVDSGTMTRRFGMFITEPTNADSYMVAAPTLTHLGRHRVKVYRINDEYADLYEGRQQDSRDLNEPPTNIENGLGVFSAFNCDSVFFYATQE